MCFFKADDSIKIVDILFIAVLGFELGLHLEPLHQPYFCDRVLSTICPGWL
jgi:hypothetical protein